ncbi:MAG: tetratricopeptide repeat protein [Deltaproteobacteria bacterium]|nr:tetratricopeptide repeat protein [Deltaproteobacteria bacterium]
MAEPRSGSAARRTEHTQFFSMAMLELAREAPAWVKSARAHLQQGRFAQAQQELEAGLASSPGHVEGLLFLAEAHWEQVHAPSALDCLKQAIQAAPRDARAYALLGRYLLLKGLREQAVKFLEHAVTLDPNDHHSRKALERTRNLIQKGYRRVERTRLGAPPGDAPQETRLFVRPVPDPQTAPPPPPAAGAGPSDPTAEQAAPAAAVPEPGISEGEVERALAALITGNLFPVDLDHPAVDGARRRPAWQLLAAVLLLALAAAAGAPAGLLLRKHVASARAGGAMERAYALLREDTPAAWTGAAELLDRISASSPEYEAAQPLLAMAQATRAQDLGGGRPLREEAERALSASGEAGSPARRSPAALWARHLVVRGGGEADRALAGDLRRALQDKPADAWLWAVQGRVAEDAGDDAAALDAYRAAVHRDPDFPLARMGLARGHVRLGDLAEARRQLDQVLALHPGHAGAHLVLTLLAAGDPAGATVLERTRRLVDDPATRPPDAALLAAGLALAELARGQGHAAPALWARAAGASAALPFAVWQVARVRLALGEVDAAREMLAQLAENNDSDVNLHKDLARASAAAALGPPLVERARAAAPGRERGGWPTLVLPLGTVHVRPGAPFPFETVLDARFFPEAELQQATAMARDLSPRVAVARVKTAAAVARARALLASGQAAAARELLLEQRESARSDTEVLVTLAQACWRAGDRAAAEQHAREALEVNPQEPGARLLRVSLLLEGEDVARALRELDLFDQSGVESAQAHALRARALAARGRTADAQKALARALALDPGDLEVALAVARVGAPEGGGERAAAVTALTRFLQAADAENPRRAGAVDALERLGAPVPAGQGSQGRRARR